MLDGILWVLKTGAARKDLSNRYPPNQTCHPLFQLQVHLGVMEGILRALAVDVLDRADLDQTKCFIDGYFVPATSAWPSL